MTLALAVAFRRRPRPRPRPNVVFIMADDHAAHAISAYGSRVNQTPNLDRLAREGMLFANAFVTNSICTPSRAAILTGAYSHKNGVPVFNRFDGSQPTVAKLLQAAGYHTGMIGKWHLGSDPTGFDRWEILPGQGVYHDPVLYTATGEKTYSGRYVTDVITDLAIDFIRERPKDRPFFLMLHHKAPHREWTPDERHRRMFEGRAIPEPPTLWDDYATRTDALRENQQRVADDLTRRDLKLEPPPGLEGQEREAWLSVKPTEVALDRGREDDDPHRRGPRPLEVPALHAGLPGLRAVDRRQRGPPPRLPEARAASSGTRSSSTRATRASSSATTASTTSASCTRRACGCRSSCAGRRRCGRARGRRRWPSTWTSPPPSSRPPGWRCPPRCRAGASCRCSAGRRRRTGAPRSTTATTTTPGTTTRAPTTASGPRRTSSSTSGRRTSGSCSTCAPTPPSCATSTASRARRRSPRSSRRRSRGCGPSCRTTTASPTSSRPAGVDGTVAALRGK